MAPKHKSHNQKDSESGRHGPKHVKSKGRNAATPATMNNGSRGRNWESGSRNGRYSN